MFFLLHICSFRKVIKNFEGKVYVEKGTLRVERKINNICFIQMICALGSYYYKLRLWMIKVFNGFVIGE